MEFCVHSRKYPSGGYGTIGLVPSDGLSTAWLWPSSATSHPSWPQWVAELLWWSRTSSPPHLVTIVTWSGWLSLCQFYSRSSLQVSLRLESSTWTSSSDNEILPCEVPLHRRFHALESVSYFFIRAKSAQGGDVSEKARTAAVSVGRWLKQTFEKFLSFNPWRLFFYINASGFMVNT